MAREWRVVSEYAKGNNQWWKIWHPGTTASRFRVAQDWSGWFYLISVVADTVGPFETFEAAAACFETLVGLD